MLGGGETGINIGHDQVRVGVATKKRGIRPHQYQIIGELPFRIKSRKGPEIELPKGVKLTGKERGQIYRARKDFKRYGRGKELAADVSNTEQAKLAARAAETEKRKGLDELTLAEIESLKKEGIDDKKVRKDMIECAQKVLVDPKVRLYGEQDLIKEGLDGLLKDETRRNKLATQILTDEFSDEVLFKLLAPDVADRNKISGITDYMKKIRSIRNEFMADALKKMATKGHHLWVVGQYSNNMTPRFFFAPSAACADEGSGSPELAIAKIDDDQIESFAKCLSSTKLGVASVDFSPTGAMVIAMPISITESLPLTLRKLNPEQKAVMADFWERNKILQHPTA